MTPEQNAPANAARFAGKDGGAEKASPSQQQLNEAAYWIVRLSSDRCSVSDKIAFSNWIESAKAHATAFDAVADAWQIAAFSQLKPAKQSSSKMKSWGYVSAIAASMLVAVAAIFWQSLDQQALFEQSYQTQRGEFASIELPDGSTIELNTDSKLEVYFDEQSRQLSLLSGEAYFDINTDSKRPLSVNLDDALVTVVGTEFNIHKQEHSSHILVTEGTVRVVEQTGHEQIAGRKALLSEGQQLHVFKRTGLGPVMPKRENSSIHWRDRTLVFQETKLQEVLQELNRYLAEPIDSSDDSLRYPMVSGTFSLEEPDTTLAALIETFAITKGTNEAGQTRLYIK